MGSPDSHSRSFRHNKQSPHSNPDQQTLYQPTSKLFFGMIRTIGIALEGSLSLQKGAEQHSSPNNQEFSNHAVNFFCTFWDQIQIFSHCRILADLRPRSQPSFFTLPRQLNRSEHPGVLMSFAIRTTYGPYNVYMSIAGGFPRCLTNYYGYSPYRSCAHARYYESQVNALTSLPTYYALRVSSLTNKNPVVPLKTGRVANVIISADMSNTGNTNLVLEQLRIHDASSQIAFSIPFRDPHYQHTGLAMHQAACELTSLFPDL